MVNRWDSNGVIEIEGLYWFRLEPWSSVVLIVVLHWSVFITSVWRKRGPYHFIAQGYDLIDETCSLLTRGRLTALSRRGALDFSSLRHA
jgi:hypothetical protein